MLLNCVLLLGTFMETFALQWTSSATFPNGTRINVCLGDNVTLPWTFDVTSSEHVIDVEWYQVYQNREIPLAAYIGNRFLAYGDLDRRLYFVPNAGLQLLGVTSADMEMYTVRVNVNGVIQPFSQTAFLDEPEVPVTVGGRLNAYILPVTQFPVINGESHLQLGCGHFQSLGEPPISVTWRTPSAQLRSSTYNDSAFVLTLSNPIEGGNYTCQLNGASTAEKCLQNNPLFHAVATVYVDEVTSTLILLRNDMKWLREENLRIMEENARLSEENARQSETITTQSELLNSHLRPHSCLDIQEYDQVNRVHTIYPDGSHPVNVYCDQTTDNGGWTVIQRRQDGSVDFYRNWTEYESGFGNPVSEYWIGLANLHMMTSSKIAILQVDLMDFNGTTAYVTYNTFNVSGPGDNYRLTIGGYQGTTGDSMQYQNNMQFSTYDRDHDTDITLNCAEERHGAWWYNACSDSNLNGRYYSSETYAFQWTSSSTFPNGTRINVCLGDNVTFPWRYSVNSSEHVIDVEWYQVYQDRDILLAVDINNQFLEYANLGSRLDFVPNAGLQLSGVTSSELGQYFVRVNLNGDQMSSQTAFLQEPEAPVILLNHLYAYILPESQFPVINGESHLQLGCGPFLSLGEPPASVTWRTPSGQFRNSTYSHGTFFLTLSRPIEGGNYTCQVNGASATERCMQSNSSLHTSSTVYVDEVTSLLLLLSNDVKWLREENARQQSYSNEFELLDASNRPHSCVDVKGYDGVNRIHTIYPNGSHPVKVYCDQSTDTGGWTVIQRRLDGSVDFYRNWTEYESGFGNPVSEYWIGLENLHLMTGGRAAVLRVDLMDFSGNTTYAKYNTFRISGPEDNYRLQISSYTGTAGDSLHNDNNMQFTTFDRDHDIARDYNCATTTGGAWWYYSCSESNLNGQYYQIEVNGPNGIWWYYWHNTRSLKRVEMKIRT